MSKLYNKHIKAGRLYGFPECCIMHFAMLADAGAYELQEYVASIPDEVLDTDNPHVPCPECLAKMQVKKVADSGEEVGWWNS